MRYNIRDILIELLMSMIHILSFGFIDKDLQKKNA